VRKLSAVAIAIFLILSLALVASAEDGEREWSEWSETVTATTDPEPEPDPDPEDPDDPLGVPQNVRVEAASHEALDVEWDSVDEAHGYEAACNDNAVETTETSVTIDGLEADTEYDCRVRAYLDHDAPDPEPDPDPDPEDPEGRDEIIDGAGLSDPGAVPDESEGTIRVEEAGAVIEDRHASFVVIDAPDVTLRNVKVESSALYGVRNTAAHDGLLIEDSELVCNSAPDVTSSCLISWGEHAVTNTYIEAFGADASKASRDAVYEGNHIVATKPDGSDHHTDGIQVRSGGNLSIVGNVIDAPAAEGGNAALIIQAKAGNIDGVEIRDNFLSGGNFTVYTTQTDPYQMTNAEVVNNVFAPHMDEHPLGYRFGPHRNTGGASVEGNTFIDGSPVN